MNDATATPETKPKSAREINATLRYTMWSVFKVRDLLTGDGLADEVEQVLAPLREADLVMVTTAHTNVDYAFVQKNAKFVFDTKNAMKAVTERGNIEVL